MLERRRFLRPVFRFGPLFDSTHFKDTKDPCVVFDGTLWHIFGSGGTTETETWRLLHATATDLLGPWTEEDPLDLIGVKGSRVAAPGVIYDETTRSFHMALHEDFMTSEAGINYLSSTDGHTFTLVNKLLEPLPENGEVGLYDPHFSVIKGEKYMTYSATSENFEGTFIPRPDIYLAKSRTTSWSGPWERVGKILSHEEIDWHHNQHSYHDYEWGIEGPQLFELPNGKILLNATCFLAEGPRGTRQRVFFAVSNTIIGTYQTTGPVLNIDPSHLNKIPEWESGENGHASVCIEKNTLSLFYQARSRTHTHPPHNNWRYGIAQYAVDEIELLLTHLYS